MKTITSFTANAVNRPKALRAAARASESGTTFVVLKAGAIPTYNVIQEDDAFWRMASFVQGDEPEGCIAVALDGEITVEFPENDLF